MDKFIVEQGPDRGEFFDLDRDRTTIGQGPLSDFALPDDASLADPHTLVRRYGKDFYIYPLARSRPFLLNDRLLKEPARLYDGDRIALGKTVIICHFALAGLRARHTLWRGISLGQIVVSIATVIAVALLLAGVLFFYGMAARDEAATPGEVSPAPGATVEATLSPASPTDAKAAGDRSPIPTPSASTEPVPARAR